MALLDQLAAAISTGEGYGASPANRPTRNNNPGDLTGTGYVGQTGTDAQGFAIFSTPAAGQAALQQYLSQNLSAVGTGAGPYGSLTSSSTLQDFLDIYAGNPGAGYVSAVAQGVGAAPTTTLGQLQGLMGAQGVPLAPTPSASTSSILDELSLGASASAAGISPLAAVVGALVAASVLYLALG